MSVYRKPYYRVYIERTSLEYYAPTAMDCGMSAQYRRLFKFTESTHLAIL